MIIFKNLMMTISIMACLSVVTYATDEEESSLESKTSTFVSFFDPHSVTIFLENIVDENKESKKEDSAVIKTLKYLKRSDKLRISDREIIVNCLIQKNKLDEAADFLWYTLTALEGCDKDLFNYYRTILPNTVEIQRPENLENKEKFKTAIVEFWRNSFQTQRETASHPSWIVPLFDSSEGW